ncbi:hypothetical protein ABZT43_47430 [Streptomyces sp. NPDC005349]|uniref:hypothetical protein n=1 Tax=Streptomyces sp. NPDC005349 TaxID=3157037 RepID=UPI0033AD5591
MTELTELTAEALVDGYRSEDLGRWVITRRQACQELLAAQQWLRPRRPARPRRRAPLTLGRGVARWAARVG